MCSQARRTAPSRSPLAAWLGLPLVSLLVGCSVSAVADGQDASDSSASQSALVTIERTQEGTKTEVVARVLRSAERAPIDEAALRLAGFPDEAPALGTCIVPLQGNGAPAARGLELVDLGQVAVELADGTRTSLAPRHVPDPAGALSGVVYNARISDPERALPRDELPKVVVRATGNAQDPEAISFVAQISVPRDVTDVRLAAQDPRDVTAPSGPIELTWGSLSSGEGESTIAIDVRASDGRTLTRCSFADTGRAWLPLSVDEGTLVVHRVQRDRFHVDGHKSRRDDGEIRFDTSRVVAFARRTR